MIDMLICDLESRGNDAAGVCIVNGPEISVFKEDCPAWRLVRGDGYKGFIKAHLRRDTDIVLVHTRWWTKGNPRDAKNNHPVYAGKAAVVHNGGIWNDDHLFGVNFGDSKLERKADVDTDIIRAIVDRYGLTVECIKELRRMNGNAACAIVHPDFPGDLLFLRSGNPLCLATADDILAFASTKDALHKAMRPYFKKFGFPFRSNSADCGFSHIPDKTAALLTRDGEVQWHGEFELSAHYTAPDYKSRLHTQYPDRVQRADATAPKKNDKSRPEVAICQNPQCGQTLHIEERLRDRPLWKMACECCNTLLEEPPEATK